MLSMRKSFIRVLCLVQVLVVSIALTSVSYGATEKSYTKRVKGKLQGETIGMKVYSVDVTWGAMSFTYVHNGTKTWNDNTHEYDVKYTSEWQAEGNTIKLTNHSNTAVQANFRYNNGTQYSGVTGSFNSTVLNLPSALGKAVNASELTGVRTLTLSGSMPSGVDNLTAVGSIHVEIN